MTTSVKMLAQAENTAITKAMRGPMNELTAVTGLVGERTTGSSAASHASRSSGGALKIKRPAQMKASESHANWFDCLRMRR